MTKSKKRLLFYQNSSPNLVGVTGFEPAASTSQMSRATNCATPRLPKGGAKIRFIFHIALFFCIFIFQRRLKQKSPPCERTSLFSNTSSLSLESLGDISLQQPVNYRVNMNFLAIDFNFSRRRKRY